ncbi:hypothetical protein BDV96DRAFT_152631 [Lophiotrema nucula]|uniref:Uncharacterized protein n=1 Tax=Lophiotrema nucula TaxID=690887 RepID=A0A6A5Z0I4_9PLEO|nr:hypothetical protein BDV96DRAFT_152631 [Lophiotrema nucula]
MFVLAGSVIPYIVSLTDIPFFSLVASVHKHYPGERNTSSSPLSISLTLSVVGCFLLVWARMRQPRLKLRTLDLHSLWACRRLVAPSSVLMLKDLVAFDWGWSWKNTGTTTCA